MLTLSMVRSHWRDLLATMVALSLGVAISAAALLVFASAKPEVPARFAGAVAIVRAPAAGQDAEAFTEYLPWNAAAADDIAARLREQPGVAAAVPVRTFYAQLVIGDRPAGNPNTDDPEGRSWSTASLAPYSLSAGRAPARPDEVVVSEDYDVHVGQQIAMITAPGERRVTVTGTVDGPGIYLPDDQARLLSGGSTLIGVAAAAAGTDPDPGELASQVRLAVDDPGATVLTGDARSAAEPEGTARTRYLGTQLLTVMLVLTCFSAAFVVSQSFALAAAHRRRDVALLRALGGTPRQVHAMMLREAAAVGLAGSIIGALLGSLLAPPLGQVLVRAGLEPTGFQVRTDPLVLLGVVLLGPLLAMLAIWATGRRAGRISPLEAIRSAQVEGRRLGRLRLACGVLAAVGAVVAAVASATAGPTQIASLATVATLFVIAAVTLLGPVVLPPLVRALTLPLARGRKATGVLVHGAMTTSVSRTTATMAPVLATVAFATLVLGYVETGRTAYGGQGLPPSATAVVAPDGTPGLPEDAVARTRELAGAAAVEGALPTQVFTGTGGALAATSAVGLATQPPGTARISRELADLNGWRTEQTIPITLRDGEQAAVRIAEIDPGNGTSIALPRQLVREHDASALTPRIILTDASPDQLRTVARPGVRALSAEEYARVADEDEYRLLRMFVLVALGLALGYTMLSIANTLLMATAARARDFGLLRLSGATPRQVLSSLLGESLVTVTMGTALGLLAGLAGVIGIRTGLARELERDVALALPWGLLGGLAVACAVLASAASLWPAWQMVRRPPASATQGAAE